AGLQVLGTPQARPGWPVATPAMRFSRFTLFLATHRLGAAHAALTVRIRTPCSTLNHGEMTILTRESVDCVTCTLPSWGPRLPRPSRPSRTSRFRFRFIDFSERFSAPPILPQLHPAVARSMSVSSSSRVHDLSSLTPTPPHAR